MLTDAPKLPGVRLSCSFIGTNKFYCLGVDVMIFFLADHNAVIITGKILPNSAMSTFKPQYYRWPWNQIENANRFQVKENFRKICPWKVQCQIFDPKRNLRSSLKALNSWSFTQSIHATGASRNFFYTDWTFSRLIYWTLFPRECWEVSHQHSKVFVGKHFKSCRGTAHIFWRLTKDAI